MKCPECGVDNDRVIDSRAAQDGYSIRRRRECLACRQRFTTYERFEEPAIKVVKKDGCREPFLREKIRSGLEKACWKRPVSDDRIEKIVVSVENAIQERGDIEIESHEIGEMVMRQLRNIDQVAFVRFASVYREFTDIRDFVAELGPILAESDQGEN